MSIDKLVVITGASAGIGAATANIFSEQGYYLGLISRHPNIANHLDPERDLVHQYGCHQ